MRFAHPNNRVRLDQRLDYKSRHQPLAGLPGGEAIAAHSDIDMVSFTGSTGTGISVARAAAVSVKRVTQELGGKSPSVILPDADLGCAIPDGVLRAFMNAGQSCQAPTRMVVPRSLRDRVILFQRSGEVKARPHTATGAWIGGCGV